jgi:hypothetical protein
MIVEQPATAAVEALARVRRLRPPVLQVDIGDQQVYVVE